MARSLPLLESFPYVVRIEGIEIFCANPFAVADLLRRLAKDDEGKEPGDEPQEPAFELQEELVAPKKSVRRARTASTRRFQLLSESEKRAKVMDLRKQGMSWKEGADSLGISRNTFGRYAMEAKAEGEEGPHDEIPTNGKPDLPGKHVIVIRPGGRTMYWSRRGAIGEERWEPELMHAVRYDSSEDAELFRAKHPSLKRASIEALSNGA